MLIFSPGWGDLVETGAQVIAVLCIPLAFTLGITAPIQIRSAQGQLNGRYSAIAAICVSVTMCVLALVGLGNAIGQL